MKAKPSLLNVEKVKEDITYVYSKKVNDTVIRGAKKTRKLEKDKISHVINSLLPFGKMKLLDDLYLKQNCQDWINSILSAYPNASERDIRELLNDFTDSMNTRMREEEKYVVCIITSKFLVLCHSRFGEETITPKCDVIERMLDKDNVLRFVYFEREKDSFKVIFFEDTPSEFFADWLGIPEKEAFGYLGGKNKLIGEVNGSTLVMELTDEDFEKKFIEEKIFQIKDNQLILPSPIQSIPLVKIKVGKKPYEDAGDFLQDFFARKYDLAYYQEEYRRLSSSIYSWTKTVIDDKLDVRDSSGKVLVKKSNAHFLIIFANREMSIRPSFLSEIRSKLLNNETIRIFHAGGTVSQTPIKIKNMEIYNELNQKVSKVILDYFANLPINDGFEKICLYTILECMSHENSSKGIAVFLHELANGIISNIDFSGKFANAEDKVIELKCREFMSSDTRTIAEKLSQDILKKIKTSKVKIYILGANEDTKAFEPLPIQKFDDNRVQDILAIVKEKTKLSDMCIQKVPANNGTDCLLVLIMGVETYA